MKVQGFILAKKKINDKNLSRRDLVQNAIYKTGVY